MPWNKPKLGEKARDELGRFTRGVDTQGVGSEDGLIASVMEGQGVEPGAIGIAYLSTTVGEVGRKDQPYLTRETSHLPIPDG